MSKHTPGPWDYHATGARLQIRNNIPRIIAVIELENPFVTGDHTEDVANARLIAAAPDLLAALKEVVEWCDLIETHYPEMRFTKTVRTAIARAQGKVTPCLRCGKVGPHETWRPADSPTDPCGPLNT